MRDGVRASFACDLDQAFRNQRTRNRGAEQVFAFVHGISAEHRKDEVAHEFFTYVIDINIFRLDAELDGLGARRLQLFALTQISGEGDDLALIIILQPFQND